MSTAKFVVPKAVENVRIEKFCLKLLPNIKLSQFFKLLRLGKVLLNNTKAKLGQRVSSGDTIVFQFAIEPYLHNHSEVVDLTQVQDDLQVIFEDEQLIVVDKPAGVVCQPDAKHELFNLANSLLKHCGYNQYFKNSLSFIPRFAHRIDRNTCGLVIGAKTNQALQELEAVFRHNLLMKQYQGLVFGPFNFKGTQKAYWAKDAYQALVTVKAKPFPNAKPITTIFENSKYLTKLDLSLLTIRLVSGKTHQIRACLNLLNTQLVGDRKYQLLQFKNRNRDFKHQALHATNLSFAQLDKQKFPLLVNYSQRQFKSQLVPWFASLIKGVSI
ncbi:RluA family pseudouridine synthase [Mycoplasmoides pneumoniae]|uniref:RluA family pseudouridine synthase n=1 Tax=Mycoplasmoides pneumoniae TaxID=2104 RepID=UPI0006BA5A3E|nr:RluA family pseudouridine synthase [Mycoplasmoides pneumoniae]